MRAEVVLDGEQPLALAPDLLAWLARPFPSTHHALPGLGLALARPVPLGGMAGALTPPTVSPVALAEASCCTSVTTLETSTLKRRIVFCPQ